MAKFILIYVNFIFYEFNSTYQFSVDFWESSCIIPMLCVGFMDGPDRNHVELWVFLPNFHVLPILHRQRNKCLQPQRVVKQQAKNHESCKECSTRRRWCSCIFSYENKNCTFYSSNRYVVVYKKHLNDKRIHSMTFRIHNKNDYIYKLFS